MHISSDLVKILKDFENNKEREIDISDNIKLLHLLVDLHKDLVKDIIDLQGQPGQCEEGHHQHQHLYHLE